MSDQKGVLKAWGVAYEIFSKGGKPDAIINALHELVANEPNPVEDTGDDEIWGFYEERFPIYTDRKGAHGELGSRMTVEEANGLVKTVKGLEKRLRKLVKACQGEVEEVFAFEIGDEMNAARKELRKLK